MDNRSVELYMRWQEASAQLNGFIRTIKLTRTTFDTLGPDGKAYFQHHATILLAIHTDFFADASNPNRIYLGNPTEIEQETRGKITWFYGIQLPIIQPGTLIDFHSEPPHDNNNDHNDGHDGDYDNDNDEDEVEDKFIIKYNGTKPPPNAFLRFRTAQIPILRRDNPRMHETAISGVTKGMWNDMSDDEQAPWYALARSAQEDFKKSYPDYYKDRLAYSKSKRGQKTRRVRQRRVESPLERQDPQPEPVMERNEDLQNNQFEDYWHFQGQMEGTPGALESL
ncbi:hypothetical protein F5B21DRAFT_509669 [Xylaria acuta]|nr:hypothetical protein F5B21DRAFT_509669 [Xylaria acuta]